MWCSISRFFNKQDVPKQFVNEKSKDSVMDRGDNRRLGNSYDGDRGDSSTKQAKQRATIKWLLSKAFNNQVPENLREPFYRDHEEQEHLKPQLVHLLANAELYCLALANIYSDPNYHNMNHSGVLQVLLRKGVFVCDTAPTETVLIQTNPLKLCAHMSVMEAVMSLYAKEVATSDRVLAAVQRFSQNGPSPQPPTPIDHEQALLLWINRATAALRERIRDESTSSEHHNDYELPRLTELQDLSDGVSLASLIAFYCPEELPWKQITFSKVPTMSDRVRNLVLVYEFCFRSLPHSVFHMTPEDVCYMRESMKQNLVVFLADLFNVLEIHPAKCVRFDSGGVNLTQAYPRNSQGVAHKRCLPQSVSAIPDLRSSLDSHSSFTGSPIVSSGSLKKSHSIHQSEIPPEYRGDEEFVVHKGRGVPTLSSVLHDGSGSHSSTPVASAKAGVPSKAEPAGKPSNWEDSKRPTYAGRRSRRNSLSDDSQLTLENFGGSQENLHLLGRNPDKEPAIHVGRRDSSASRSSINDNKSTALHNALQEQNGDVNEFKKVLPATVTRTTSLSGGGGDIADSERSTPSPSPAALVKKTTFAALPTQSTTTWQQQLHNHNQNQSSEPSSENESTEGHGGVMASQYLNIRLKLEEKRRRIESDKRRMEAVVSRQRQKVGKAAFLQAVTKGQGQGQKANVKSPDSDPGRETNGDLSDLPDKPQRPFSLQDITEVEQKWLVGETFTEERKTPDIDSMDIESCQQSIAQYNSSLHEIQADIQRLQQSQMQQPPTVAAPTMSSFASLHHNNFQSPSNNQVPPQTMSPASTTALNNQQIHSLLYNNHPTQNQWHSLISQQPGNNYQNDYIHLQQTQQNNFINQQQQQQQQIHSLMNQQALNSFATTMTNQRNFIVSNQQSPAGGGGFLLSQQPPPASTQPPHNYNDSFHSVTLTPQQHMSNQHHQQMQQQQQVNQLLRGDSVGGGGGGEFYLHEPPPPAPVSAPTTQRRTWAQPASDHHNTWSNSSSSHHSQQPASLSSSPHKGGGFLLHHNGDRESPTIAAVSGYRTSPPSLAATPTPTPPPRRVVTHAPLPTPPVDDMEPQSISFIGSAEEDLNSGLSRMNITSGNRTYRIPSPTRTHIAISRNSFSHQPQQHQSPQPPSKNHQQVTPPNTPSHAPTSASTEKGFYISFDDETLPKRPKPPLRVKRASPKKERALTQVLDTGLNTNMANKISNDDLSSFSVPKSEHISSVNQMAAAVPKEPPRVPPTNQNSDEENVFVIGNELGNPDPSTLDEMERKKERILMLSLQRRQAQEEAKARKETEEARRRENEKRKEEERIRKKEEEKARRAAILDQYKLKKAIEEAEREGKLIDKDLLNSLKSGQGGGPPKLRGKTQASRPRPKTIHIDSGHTDAHDGMLTSSRGKKGSSSNLSVFSTPIRRDYYRGSQDCLAETRRTSGNIYSELGDDSRGASPGRSLGRRGSYKTSRDASPEQTRTRSKYATYQSRRKSNSLMNLSGSSVDQDSLLYRYGDTDSGLGRATPPRRAPSPGHHPPSPSGPGSLPAHRRRYDDTASESGGSEYSGPRLYKQPATKSNKGIILNAVEYCVFPGVVNREQKRKVLEEISRSEAKHFLILFRDAGCQFRALYSYCPDTEEVVKLYGTGPKLVNDRMYDKFFKYNSGGKCFSQVHTKHLTVTIDAFTIHNSLWQGKKVNLPNKRDMTLVI